MYRFRVGAATGTSETRCAALRESRRLPRVRAAGRRAGSGRRGRFRHRGAARRVMLLLVRTARQLHFGGHPEILGRFPPVIGLVADLLPGLVPTRHMKRE